MYSNRAQWKRIRERILISGESIRSVARDERMSRNTVKKILAHDSPPGYGGRSAKPKERSRRSTAAQAPRHRDRGKLQWMEWLYRIEREPSGTETLGFSLHGRSATERRRLLCVMARESGFTSHAISKNMGMSRNSIRRSVAAFHEDGIEKLLSRKPRQHLADDEALKNVLFALLHEPPSLSGYNRTTWRMRDLREAMATKGVHVGDSVIRQAIKKAGFRWRSAKVVLTSTDPEYREKLERVQTVLSKLREDEGFFSIDEYGPFAVKAKPGRLLAGPGENPSVPQWQKSKGWLILTAAIELSRNQVTHFYSRAKNTREMIKMTERLLEQYAGLRTIYLS